MSKRSANGLMVGSISDQRGRHEPANKTPEWQRNLILEHINSFPRMESHYCRQDTQRQYLDSTLTIKKMYEQFQTYYDEHALENRAENLKCPLEQTYRRIFCSEFNLSFFVPCKDQCVTCTIYRTASDESKAELKENYDEHIRQKELAQSEKAADKVRMASEPGFHAATFDMQSVLQIPSGQQSLLYYKRKLVLHNLTIYESSLSHEAGCYLWMETDGKRGANEIGTILFRYLSKLPGSVEHVSLTSDSCCGQNRNKIVSAILLHAVKVLPIKIIDQKFLVSGHTQMECDSMHAAIENSKKHLSVYTVHEWENITKMARRNHPYTTEQLSFSDFFDLRKLAVATITNTNKNTDGDTVNWFNIRFLRYEKENPYQISYKTSFDSESFGIISQGRAVGRRPRKIIQPGLVCAYTKQLPISQAKKADLLELCNKGVIPQMNRDFFQNLKCCGKLKDSLPEPNIDEASETED